MLEFGRADSALVQGAFTRAMNAFGMVPDHSRTAFWQDAAHPRRAGRLSVFLRGLCAVIPNLSDAVKTAIREQIAASFATPEQFTSSMALFLRESSGLPNALGSFLGGDGHEQLGTVFESAIRSAMMPQSPAEMVSVALAKLNLAPEDFDAWRTLIFSAADHPLPPALASTLDHFLAGLDLQKLARLLPDKQDELLEFLAVRCALNPSSALQTRCEEHVFSRARNLAQAALDDIKLYKHTAKIGGCLMLLAVLPGNEAATHERMHKFLVRLLQFWPPSARILRHRFDGWPTQMPFTRQRGLWELEMTLRAVL